MIFNRKNGRKKFFDIFLQIAVTFSIPAVLTFCKYEKRRFDFMKPFTILTDSSADLTAEMKSELGIKIVPLTVQIDGEKPISNEELDIRYFYDCMKEGKRAKTAAVNPAVATEVMENEVLAGNDVLFLSFSSNLSSTYNISAIAAQDLSEKYPDSKIIVIDTLCESFGLALLVNLCVEQAREGKTIEEVAQFAEETKGNIAHWFTVDDLNHLRRGGRVSAAKAVVGTMLGIKPVLHMSDDGKLVPMFNARGRKASMKMLVDKTIENARDFENQTIFINHSDSIEDAEKLKEMILEAGAKDVRMGEIGPVVGAHCGRGTLAIYSICETR